jgi:peptidoglycan hydrolase CwlO-like protein
MEVTMLRIILFILLYIGQATISAQSVNTRILSSNDTLPVSTTTVPSKNRGASNVDSLNYSLQHKKDTVQRKLDSLKYKTAHIQDNARYRLDSVNGGIAQSSKSIGDKAKNVTQNVSVSEQMAHLNIPDTGASIPDIGQVSTDVDLPSDIKMPAPNAIPLDQPDISAITPTTKVGEISNLNENIPNVSEDLSTVDGYVDDLQKIKEGAQKDPNELTELAEQNVSDIPAVNEATQELTKVTEEQAKYEAMIQRYRDQKLIQEEINRKYRAVANDYVMQQSEKLNAACDKLNISKYKKRGLGSVKDVFKKQSDELEGKKFYQRLVPGLNWQIYNKVFVSSDISLQTGYRFTPRLTAGIGAVYRVGFDKKFDSFVKGMKTFGGRVYMDMLVVKGMFVHGEFEALKQDASYTLRTHESISPRVYESNFGLGKRFNITRSIRGNVIALYRIEYRGELPAANRVNVRMGIDYVFRRPKKKLNGL